MLNPVALRKAKIVYNFGLSECNRVKTHLNSLCRDYHRQQLTIPVIPELLFHGAKIHGVLDKLAI